MEPASAMQPSLMRVGQRVRARREADLPPEWAVVRSVEEGATCTVRFEDGFLLPGVPAHALVERVERSAAEDEENRVNSGLRRRHELPSFGDDAAYDAEVAPLLPSAPEDTAGIHACAMEYKVVGNTLFKEGKHGWALRVYLSGYQLLQKVGYGNDVQRMIYDVDAAPFCIASFSNAALCALKTRQPELALQLCERGELFGPEGTELGKLLVRKATALLERTPGADPETAIEILERAAAPEVCGRTRPVVELLQRAKKLAKERQKAADRALFNGKGFGDARLTEDSAAKADARRECDELLRRGTAALLGTSPKREVVPAELKDALGGEAPKVDAAAAAECFAQAEACAKAVGLRKEEAHAVFGAASAAAESKDWAASAKGFVRYFSFEIAPSDAPLVGDAYGRYFAGMAAYNTRDVSRSIEQFEAYLLAVSSFCEINVCTRDAYGVETITDFDKALLHQRRWAVSGRCEHQARRLLANLYVHAAAMPGASSASKGMLLSDGVEQLNKAFALAWDDESRSETTKEREGLEGMMEKRLQQQQQEQVAPEKMEQDAKGESSAPADVSDVPMEQSQ